LHNDQGEPVKFSEPQGPEMPPNGFDVKDAGYQAPAKDGRTINVIIRPDSDRLQMLTPFNPWNGEDYTALRLLIKAKGKCTTDHISMAGPWLKYRGHLENISSNLLIGAVNYFNDEANKVKNFLTGNYSGVPATARSYKEKGIGSLIVGDDNYGEGSSREHAAMEPRHMGVKAVLVRSFARIHETNLKKQGILALSFIDKADYDRIVEDDVIDITGLKGFAPGKNLSVILHHSDGKTEKFEVSHTYNDNQIEWFRAGSALNLIRLKLH
jgi:aconitate hydratase